MAVCFREESGKKSRFGLSSDGRVSVDEVRRCLGADVVKWQDECGGGVWNYLQVRPGASDGLSFQVFQDGAIVDVSLDVSRAPARVDPPGIRRWQLFDKSYQEVPAQPVENGVYPTVEPPWPAVYRGVPPVDVDEYGVDLKLLQEIDRAFSAWALAFTWTEVKTETMESATKDPMSILLSRSLFDAMDGEPDWEVRPGVEERAASLKIVWEWMSLAQGSSFKWLKQEKLVNAKRKVGRFSFIIRNWSDAVLADDDDSSKAVLGISFVQKLTWRAGWRCQLDFYLWATGSSVPYVQVVTDMKTGGIACVAMGPDDEDSKKMLLWRFAMYGMEELEEFFRLFGGSLPKNVKSFTVQQREVFETDPPRVIFPYPGFTMKCA